MKWIIVLINVINQIKFNWNILNVIYLHVNDHKPEIMILSIRIIRLTNLLKGNILLEI